MTNVETRGASVYDLPMADRMARGMEDGSVDRAFPKTARSQVPERHLALLESRRVLMPGAMRSTTEEFLDPDRPLARATIRWASEAGFELAKRYGNSFACALAFEKHG